MHFVWQVTSLLMQYKHSTSVPLSAQLALTRAWPSNMFSNLCSVFA
jgi:hypothetical protein